MSLEIQSKKKLKDDVFFRLTRKIKKARAITPLPKRPLSEAIQKFKKGIYTTRISRQAFISKIEDQRKLNELEKEIKEEADTPLHPCIHYIPDFVGTRILKDRLLSNKPTPLKLSGRKRLVKQHRVELNNISFYRSRKGPSSMLESFSQSRSLLKRSLKHLKEVKQSLSKSSLRSLQRSPTAAESAKSITPKLRQISLNFTPISGTTCKDGFVVLKELRKRFFFKK